MVGNIYINQHITQNYNSHPIDIRQLLINMTQIVLTAEKKTPNTKIFIETKQPSLNKIFFTLGMRGHKTDLKLVQAE